MDESIAPADVLEADSLIRVIHQAYGYDFSWYSQGSFIRRLRVAAAHFGCASLSQLQHELLHKNGAFAEFLGQVSISLTEFFRDVTAFQVLKREVIPYLRTFGRLKVWHAGCASGEELFSLAIILAQEGLLERARLYGTDINPEAIAKAKQAVFKSANIEAACPAFSKLGYKTQLRDHFREAYGGSLLEKRYRDRAVFSNHNLVTDAKFGEFELICCRNVLIYFNWELQLRVLHLFHDALEPGGYLCLGVKEAMPRDLIGSHFELVDGAVQLYRKSWGSSEA